MAGIIDFRFSGFSLFIISYVRFNWSGASRSNWLGASWVGASWVGASWVRASWVGASWVGASGVGASGVGASWVGASWVGASGVGASWVGASWVGASWVGASWVGAGCLFLSFFRRRFSVEVTLFSESLIVLLEGRSSILVNGISH